jgi:hypothetical protein
MLDTYDNFINSIRISNKYYHDICIQEEINIIEFDNEYIRYIDKLSGEFIKYYILKDDDSNIKYICINNDIKLLYNYMINNALTCTKNKYLNRVKLLDMPQFYGMAFIKDEENFLFNINIKFLTEDNLSRLFDIYTYNTIKVIKCGKEFIDIFKINTVDFEIYNSNVECVPHNEKCPYHTSTKYNKSKQEYLNSLCYHTLEEMKFKKILINVPKICLVNLKNKKNNINLLD